MKNNVGLNDKILRMIIAAVFAILAFQVHGAFGVVSLVLMATVILSWCPINQALGRNTCEVEQV